jgi:hypothetical protein
MMDLFLNFFIIQVIVCFIVDLSGFIPEMEDRLSKWLGFRCVIPKPWSCSLCMGFWINLIIILILGQFNILNLLVISMLSFFSKNITGFLRWTSELLVKIETLLYKIIR